MADLNGKVAIVTGAASGLGKATAEAFGRLDILHNNAALTSVDVIGRDVGWTEFDPSLSSGCCG